MQWRTFASKRFDRNHDCVCSEQNKNHMKIIIKETHNSQEKEKHLCDLFNSLLLVEDIGRQADEDKNNTNPLKTRVSKKGPIPADTEEDCP